MGIYASLYQIKQYLKNILSILYFFSAEGAQ